MAVSTGARCCLHRQGKNSTITYIFTFPCVVHLDKPQPKHCLCAETNVETRVGKYFKNAELTKHYDMKWDLHGLLQGEL
jgi:hypothetical protein